MSKLISLDLSGNNISTLPKELFQLHHLEVLHLDNNVLETLPKNISQLQNLKNLNLSENKISVLPKELFQIENLQELSLCKNQIEILDNLFKLHNLTFLDISYNNIQNFPNQILTFSKLEQIYFLNNPYKNFPELKIELSEDEEIGIFNLLKKLTPFPSQKDNYNYFTLKIPKALQTPLLQYIEFFKDYVEATKGKNIVFDVKRDKEGLILITNGNSNITLPELGNYFQEYVALTQQQSENWIFDFETPTTVLKADILRLKMENEIGRFKNALAIARMENEHLSVQLRDTQGQNAFLRELSQSLSHKIDLLIKGRTPETLNVDQLLIDIVDQATKMLERKYSQQLEDLHNDVLTDFLRQKGYYATDQTRSGRSKLSVGEIDPEASGMVRKRNGTPFSILEAFRLNSCGTDNKIVAAHLDKLLHDYDTAGHERNFAIIYAEAKNFERLWKNYKTYVSELNGKLAFRATYPLISFKEKQEVSTKTSIKTGIAKHRREGIIVEVYHVFINMFATRP